ncbi:TPA: hypothetical protein GXZ54_01565 [bacterium]|nr:hypothetical protein [bacterium]
MESVLFSPIGVNDPFGFNNEGGYNEGALLTIIRETKPSYIYLYMTNDVTLIEEKDKRYTKALDLLVKELELDCEYEIINEVEELPNRYVNYYKRFARILSDINEKHRAQKIVVNGSSGTPTIRSALMLLSTNLPFNITVKQVGVVEFTYNKEELEEYNVEEIKEQVDIEKNEKCWTIDTKYLTSLKLNKIVKDFIKDFDYVNARKLVLQPMFRLRNKEIKDLLDLACYRLNNEFDKALEIEQEKGFDVLPYKEKKLGETFEFIVNLWIMLRQKRHNEFARLVCPILDRIAKELITEERLNQLTDVNNNYDLSISDDKIIANHPDLINYLNSVNFVRLRGRASFSFYRHVINYFYQASEDNNKKRRLKEILTDLRRVEDRLKYYVNHTIAPIEDKDIQKWTGLNSDSILMKIISLLGFAYPGYNFSEYFERNKGLRQFNRMLMDKIDENFFEDTQKSTETSSKTDSETEEVEQTVEVEPVEKTEEVESIEEVSEELEEVAV